MVEKYTDEEVDAAKVKYEELTRMILDLSEQRLKAAEILDSRGFSDLWPAEVVEINEQKRRIKLREDEGVRSCRANDEFETWYFSKDGAGKEC